MPVCNNFNIIHTSTQNTVTPPSLSLSFVIHKQSMIVYSQNFRPRRQTAGRFDKPKIAAGYQVS